MHFILNPECCGVFGRKTLYAGELTERPPQVYRLHYEFERWPSDELLEVSCLFIGTEAMMEEIKAQTPRPSGITFDEVIATGTPECRTAHAGEDLPLFKWFKIIGKAGIDDFGMTADHRLVVSDRIFGLIRSRIEHCNASLYRSEPSQPLA
jgi:hypothetical protein